MKYILFIIAFWSFCGCISSQSKSKDMQLDTILLSKDEIQEWKTDSLGKKGLRLEIYSEKILERDSVLKKMSRKEVEALLGNPNEILPISMRNPPKTWEPNKVFIYYIYDNQFNVDHEYKVYFRDDKVTHVYFERGQY